MFFFIMVKGRTFILPIVFLFIFFLQFSVVFSQNGTTSSRDNNSTEIAHGNFPAFLTSIISGLRSAENVINDLKYGIVYLLDKPQQTIRGLITNVLNGIVEIFLNGVDLIFGSDNIISMFVRNSGFCLQFSTYGILANIEIGVISCGTDQVAYLLKLAQNVLTNVGNLIDLILTVIQQLLGGSVGIVLSSASNYITRAIGLVLSTGGNFAKITTTLPSLIVAIPVCVITNIVSVTAEQIQEAGRTFFQCVA